MASLLEMYSKYGLAYWICSAKWEKIGRKMANGRLLFQALGTRLDIEWCLSEGQECIFKLLDGLAHKATYFYKSYLI